ncbi:unnamed protein product, partial [Rotaria magnacalcarata]
MTVYEQSSANDFLADDSQNLKPSKDVVDIIEKGTNDDKQT